MGKNFFIFVSLKEYNSNILDMPRNKTDFNITDNIVALGFNMPGWTNTSKILYNNVVNGVGSFERQNNLIHTNK